MRMLVTGGAGFIGSNFIRYILKRSRNVNIINLDKLTYAGNLDNLKDVENDKRYTFIKGDICDKRIVDSIFSKGLDYVVNFAAETHVDRSIIYAGDFVKTDVYGTYILLEAARKYPVRRFIHISTDEVYGSILKGSFKEDAPLNPSSPYSASKAGGDRLAYSYFITFHLPVIIIRPSNNFGPYQYPEKFIPLFITNAIEGKELPLYGDGKNIRDWFYVEECCDAIYFILKKGIKGEVYNIAGNCEQKNISVAKMILKELNKPESLIKYVKDRPGHDRRYALNITKIKRLGWQPSNNFKSYLKNTIKWYMNNEWWWKKIKRGEFKKYYKKMYTNR